MIKRIVRKLRGIELKDGYLCQCPCAKKRERRELPMSTLALKDGRRLGVIIKNCSRCGGVTFAPHENWELFLREGDPMVVVEWVEAFQKYCTEANRIKLW